VAKAKKKKIRNAGSTAEMEQAMTGLAQQLQQIMQVNADIATQIRNATHGGGHRDAAGRTPQEARREYLEFSRNRPTFERGKDRWVDFALRFRRAKDDHGVTDEQGKWVLFNAVVGQSSRLVIASMAPDSNDCARMTFAEYLRRMGERFTPAAESIQMEAEYKMRKQRKNEDVQNYVNAKYELFQLAYPRAQAREVGEFYREATEGFLNKYVRDQMFSFEAANIEAFGTRAVNLVQIERRRIRIGDSDTTKMDGLLPVTRPLRDPETGRGSEPMEVDALTPYGESAAEEAESDGEAEVELCECMALQEHGFQGPCYYCSRRGHLKRNCPRKAAGLPKARGTAPPKMGGYPPGRPAQGGQRYSAPGPPMRNFQAPLRGNRLPFRGGKAPTGRAVYYIAEEGRASEEDGAEAGPETDYETESAEAHFLGDPAL
jgi:hypothetical protein